MESKWKLVFDELSGKFYYKSKDGKKSKSFVEAYPYADGHALVKKDDGYYYFRKEDGTLEKIHYKKDRITGASEDIFILHARNDKYGLKYLYNVKTGELSLGYRYISSKLISGWGVLAEHFEHGNGCGAGRFFDGEGNIDKTHFRSVYRYKKGFAVVQSYDFEGCEFGSDPLYAFRDADGKLSETYEKAMPYDEVNGLAIVKPIGGDYRLRDLQGNLSEESFHSIKPHYVDDDCRIVNAFYSIVKKEGDPVIFLDYAGNETDAPTSEGMEFYKYLKNERTVFDLSVACFGNEKILKAIMQRETDFIEQEFNHIDVKSKNEMRRLEDLARYTGEYIKSMAFEAEQAKQKKIDDERAKQEKGTILGRMF